MTPFLSWRLGTSACLEQYGFHSAYYLVDILMSPSAAGVHTVSDEIVIDFALVALLGS